MTRNDFVQTRPGARGLAALLLAALAAGCGPAERARQFVPGEFGREPGAEAPADGRGAFRTRTLFGLDSEAAAAWGRANGLTARFAFSHNLGNLFPPELHAAHPEFFPWVAGERLHPPAGSYYWNPDLGRADVAAWTANAARARFAAHPADESFAIGVNDGLIFGESAETLASLGPARWFRGRPDYAPLVMGFANRVAEDLARTNPEKFLGTLAYYWAENAPPFRVHPQVVPFLTADRAQGYDERFRREELMLQEKWGENRRSEFGDRSAGRAGPISHLPSAISAEPPGRLGLYDYLHGGGYLVPRIHTRLLAENLRHARRSGFTDYFAELYPNWGLDGPMPWLAAQLTSDPEQSPEVLLDEYYRRCFRRAAVPMRRFFERCERQWLTQPGASFWLKHYRSPSQADLFPSEVCGGLRALLDEAARVADDESVRRRVGLTSAAFAVTERLVALHEAREALKHGMNGGAGWRQLTEELQRFLTARADFAATADRVRREEPLAIREFTRSDYLRDDPASAAVLAIQRQAEAHGEAAAAGAALAAMGDATVAEDWRASRRLAAGEGVELLRNASMIGALGQERRIAGLVYGFAMPEHWLNHAEPAEAMQAEWRDEPRRVLRLAGNLDTQVYQWVQPGNAPRHRVRVEVRGRVSPGGTASLNLGWLDAHSRRVGEMQALRLPEGIQDEWVPLVILAPLPPGAAWVGIGLRVQHQGADDWIEARAFSLQALR